MGVIEESSTEPLAQTENTNSKETTADLATKEIEDTKPPPPQEDNNTSPIPSAPNSSPNPSFNPSSPHRRPLTRSQTGTVPKRRKRDDSTERALSTASATNKKRVQAPRKRQNVSAGANASPNSSVTPETASRSQSPRLPATREGSLTSSSASASSGVGPGGLGTALASAHAHAYNESQSESYHVNPTTHGQLTFQLSTTPSSPLATLAPECRLPRSRASLPTPIPNLTKKSRGRRVPTQSQSHVSSQHSSGRAGGAGQGGIGNGGGAGAGDQKDLRLYVCTVAGCGKCFHRGEHLKRHIRSIHTHEKPFKCSFPLCQKYFNRHDNLLQHLKVHRDGVAKSTPNTSTSNPNNHTSAASASASEDEDAASPTSQQSQKRAQYAGAGSRSHHTQAEAAMSSANVYRRERSYSTEPLSPGPAEDTHEGRDNVPRTIYNAFAPSFAASGSNFPNAFPPSFNNPNSTSFPNSNPMANPNFPNSNSNSNSFPMTMSYHNNHNPYPAPMSQSYGTTSNTISLITNMAVSSLRTELPVSPGGGRGM